MGAIRAAFAEVGRTITGIAVGAAKAVLWAGAIFVGGALIVGVPTMAALFKAGMLLTKATAVGATNVAQGLSGFMLPVPTCG